MKLFTMPAVVRWTFSSLMYSAAVGSLVFGLIVKASTRAILLSLVSVVPVPIYTATAPARALFHT